jgi:hypothetical protein
MRQSTAFLVILAISCTAEPASAQMALPSVESAQYETVHAHARRLRQALKSLRASLPTETEKTLEPLLDGKVGNPAAALESIQKLLDAHCLVGVTINPESRVKAVRGPARANLQKDRDSFFLIKVANEGGVTHHLTVSGAQVRSAGTAQVGRWLEAEISAPAPLAKTLSGQKLEYVVLRLRSAEAGRREATLKFDVGQGTQDLGFRAEVPILFTVRPAQAEKVTR